MPAVAVSYKRHASSRPNGDSPADLKTVIEEKVQLWVEAYELFPKPLPPEAHEQRMAIDELHAEMIHLQEEKTVFAQQVRPPRPDQSSAPTSLVGRCA